MGHFVPYKTTKKLNNPHSLNRNWNQYKKKYGLKKSQCQWSLASGQTISIDLD